MNIKQITKAASLGLLAGLPTLVQAQKDSRPNIIIILADDLGYSDIGCYGGEINTPNLDKLAATGLRFSRFYNTSRSCPTRASLLTGLYQHQAAMGRMADTHSNLPGYLGTLSRNAVTIAEVLKTAGYQTGMIGKWHVSETFNKSDQKLWASHQVYYPDFADRNSYPVNRGFDDYYGIIWGAADYYDPFSLVNGLEPVKDVPKDYYTTQVFADSAVSYVNRYSKNEEPFFLYLAFNSPHWPLQALPEDIAKYENRYNDGWEALRNERYQRIQDMKIFGDRTDFLTPKNQPKDWSTNTDKVWDARAMAVYAAMIDRMDQGIGQLIDALEKNGQLDNTLILFMSDNGCANEPFPSAGSSPSTTRDKTPVVYPTANNKSSQNLPGPETVFAGLPTGWTNASDTPFRLWKAKSAEGGICTPMIAHWPAGIKADLDGTITEQMGHVMDIMATCIDIAGASYPETYNGYNIIPMEGLSLLPVFETGKREGHDEICFEHFEEKALITKDLWKIVQAAGSTAWQLYNLDTDRTEMKDVSKTYPDRLAEMTAAYDAWTLRCMVKPAPGDPADKTPVAISEASELEVIRSNMGGNYYLTDNIIIPDGTNWLPLGKAEDWDGTPANLTNFTGVLDGRGFSIKNLTITGDGSTFYDFSGLFARVAGGGADGGSTVKNLGLEDVNITECGGQTGGLSGTIFGDPNQSFGATIENVFVTGNIQGKTEVGGLVGRCNNAPGNIIDNCYVNASVKATGATGAYAGGILGCMNTGQKLTIKNVYAAGSVSATNFAGGILGYVANNNAATTFTLQSSAVALDEISAATKGLFYNNGLLAANKITSTNNQARNDITGITGGTQDPAALFTRDFYETTLGWDFGKTWAIEEGKGYPTLMFSDDTSLKPVPAAKINCTVYASDNGIIINNPLGLPVSAKIFGLQGQLIYNVKNINNYYKVSVNKGAYVVRLISDGKTASSIVIVK